ncbi:hypothetical protein IMSHALPRED_001286 [Imshaugia aleurites]|uniref:Uncharacterized protein n=1 Tax=Imshaugia aleurites TaxID=172621 RepID=A0A8H3J2B1_9LECA|nr:hypothetical protein IMSHALPRED_001286 [Imshaugia aleurites]
MSYKVRSGGTYSIVYAHCASIAATEAANRDSTPAPSKSTKSSISPAPKTPQTPIAVGLAVPAWLQDALVQNATLMALHESPSEVNSVNAAIEHVGPASGADVCAILCVITQESGRNFPVGAIDNGIGNPGNMQSHVGFNLNDAPGSILQKEFCLVSC